MKTNFLFPHRFKLAGWIMLIIGLIAYFLDPENIEFFEINVVELVLSNVDNEFVFFNIDKNNISDEIQFILILVGAILVGFSKTKYEDEFIGKIRFESLTWAVYVNYIILLIGIIFVYGLNFFVVMAYNLYTILIFFIVRFHWMLYRSRRTIKE